MQKLNVCVQAVCAQAEAVRRCALAPRLLAPTFAALALLLPALSARADAPDFRFRPLLAGKASLTEPGFVVRRELGVAALAPELRIPVELVYESSSEASGAFGFGWRCPQLESSVRWEKGGLLWTTPWGERIKFFPKKEKTPKDAIRLDPIEDAKKGRGLFAPYADWESDTESPDWAKCRRFSILGKGGLKGWRLAYGDGRLASVETPYGASAQFDYGPSGELLAVSSQGVRFVELSHAGGLVASLKVNGVPVALAYGAADVTLLPKTADGQPTRKSVRALASVRVAALDPEAFAYANGYLASAARGAFTERFDVQTETPADRKRNILSKDKKNNVAHTGRVAGRLLADGDYRYAYPTATAVRLTDALGSAATHEYDATVGLHAVTGFDGRTRKTCYVMRPDVAYLGKVRTVTDGQDRTLVSFRYDRKTGKPVRVTDRLGNHRLLDYDADGRCTKLSRRAGGVFASAEPVRSFAYDRQGRLAAVSELDADGKAVRTTSLAYDRAGRPSRVSDGCRTLSVAYAPSGFPSEVRDDFAAVAFAYDRYNRLVSTTDPYGTVTRRTYADHGGLAKVERLDGKEVLASATVACDGSGRPVSVTDMDGRTAACDRDALGRIVKERYADGAEVAYGYDALGRLERVVDENGHEIAFGWDRFGLSSRLTAAGQLTFAKRGADGLVAEVTASVTGRIDRTVRREHDAHGRVTRVTYAKGEVETFAYDRWGRLAERTRGGLKETYRYDHFGRLAERDENGTGFSYAYDAWGRCTTRTVRFADGGEAQEERRAYDRYGRLVEIAAFGTSVKWRYDERGRVTRQVVDGSPIDFAYTRDGRLAGKWLGGRESPDASVEYEYAKDGRIAARTANGVRQAFAYDARGQLVAVREGGVDVERYAYDRAGNMVRKTVRRASTGSGPAYPPEKQPEGAARRGAPNAEASEMRRRGGLGGDGLAESRQAGIRGNPCQSVDDSVYVTTTYTFDGANQLVSSTCDGVTTRYAYDAAGRLVREGDKTYRYGYLDKVLSVTEGKRSYTYAYHVDGQLARADYGEGRAEDFAWDGLALIRRGDEMFVNEPHVGGGNPVVSSKGAAYFNDLLGTTVGVREGRGAARKRSARRYTAAALTAFGEPVKTFQTSQTFKTSQTFFTGKPQVEGLGRVFLMRNYRSDLAKWQTADPLGYPDGWNQLAYCGNEVTKFVDYLGGAAVIGSFYDALYHYAYGNGEAAIISSSIIRQVISTDEFRHKVFDAIVSRLAEVSYYQNSGSFSLSGMIRWEQGDVLGRTATRWSVTINWTSSGWESSDTEEFRWRRVIGSGMVSMYTRDVWDFAAHENDPWWRTVFDEYMAGGCADLFSYIKTGNKGAAYTMSGTAYLNVSHSVYQYQAME